MYGILSGFVDGSLIPEKGEAIRFDRECDSWSVFSFEACRQILQRDSDFARADLYSSSARAVRGNNRSLAVLSGRDHLALHGYLTRRVGVRSSRRYREALIGPIVQAALDSLDPSSPVDVAASIADQIPIRVGLAMIGVDISDAGRVDEIAELKTRFTRWSDRDDDDPVLTQLAADASTSLKTMLMPMVHHRKIHPGEDLCSEFWRSGSTVFSDWSEVDTYAACYAFLGGGETAYAMRTCLYVLLSDSLVREELRIDPATRIPRFVSEVLRLFGPIQWLARVATSNQNVAGASIKEGDSIRLILPAANRDSRVYKDAWRIDLDSDRRPLHLSFGHGARFCIGAALARAELEEAVSAFVTRYPEARLAGDGADIVGHRIRSVAPIYTYLQ